jgi:hypothetical protein
MSNDSDKPALGPDSMAAIGRELRRIHLSIIAEGVPERFTETLCKLDDPEQRTRIAARPPVPSADFSLVATLADQAHPDHAFANNRWATTILIGSMHFRSHLPSGRIRKLPQRCQRAPRQATALLRRLNIARKLSAVRTGRLLSSPKKEPVRTRASLQLWLGGNTRPSCSPFDPG